MKLIYNHIYAPNEVKVALQGIFRTALITIHQVRHSASPSARFGRMVVMIDELLLMIEEYCKKIVSEPKGERLLLKKECSLTY